MSAKDLAARAGRVTTPEEPRKKPPAPRAKPVRLSVDLSPEQYREVTAWPVEAGIPEAAGVLKVPTVEVFRALVDELMDDPELQDRVRIRVIAELRGQVAERTRRQVNK